MHKPMKA